MYNLMLIWGMQLNLLVITRIPLALEIFGIAPAREKDLQIESEGVGIIVTGENAPMMGCEGITWTLLTPVIEETITVETRPNNPDNVRNREFYEKNIIKNQKNI